jgi:hypothetical protein
MLFSQPVRTKLATPAAWSNGLGWSPTGVPVSGEKVIIPAGVTVTITGDLTYSSLFIDVFGTLILGNNRSLTLGSSNSYINLQGTGTIEASQTSNNNSQITINGLTQFVSDQTYSTNGGGKGVIKGPALSTGAGTGFTFGIVLPVRFSSIKLQQLTNSVRISWQTGAEMSIRSFTVERSSDTRTWDVIGTVPPGTATANRYQTADLHPLKGANYYRVCAVDFDGSRIYSGITATQFEPQIMIQVSPNPAKSACRLIVPASISTSKTKYYIYSSTGLLIDNGTVSRLGASTNINVTNLSNGPYQLVVISDTGLRYNTSVSVQH